MSRLFCFYRVIGWFSKSWGVVLLSWFISAIIICIVSEHWRERLRLCLMIRNGIYTFITFAAARRLAADFEVGDKVRCELKILNEEVKPVVVEKVKEE